MRPRIERLCREMGYEPPAICTPQELLAARFGFDIQSIVKDVQERDASGDREVVRLQPRRPFAPLQGDSNATTNR